MIKYNNMWKIFWNSIPKRIIYRFAEIFVLAGITAVLFSVEFEQYITMALGTAVGAMVCKCIREIWTEIKRQSWPTETS